MLLKDKNDYYPNMSDEELKRELDNVEDDICELTGGPEPPWDDEEVLSPEERMEKEAAEYADYVQEQYASLSRKSSDIRTTLKHRKLKNQFEELYRSKKDNNSVFQGKIIPNCVRDDDLLSRDEAAKQYATYICNNDKRNNIAIVGGWGTGKSTFMNLIKKHLDEDECVFTIDYDAAAYDNQEQIWGNIYNCILKAYNENTKFSHFRYCLFKLCYKYSADYKERLLYFLLKIVALILCLSIFNSVLIPATDVSLKLLKSGKLVSIENMKTIIIWLTKYAAGCGVIVDLVSIFLPLFGGVINSIALFFRKEDSKSKTFDCSELLGTRERISSELNIIISAWFECIWNKDKDNKLVVFVDELDRCTDEGIKNFFQSVHLLLDKKRISFVFAVEEKRLAEALDFVKNKNEDEYVRRYIEKYAQNIYSTEYRYSYDGYIEYACSGSNILQDEVLLIKLCVDLANAAYTPRTVLSIIANLSFIKQSFSKIYYIEDDNTLLFYEFIPFYILYTKDPKAVLQHVGLALKKMDDIGLEYYDSFYNVLSSIESADRNFIMKNSDLLKMVIFGNAADYLAIADSYPVSKSVE